MMRMLLVAGAALMALTGTALATHTDYGTVRCLPGYMDHHESKTASRFCDATAANKRFKVKIDPDTGCAVPGQEMKRGNMIGFVQQQIRFDEYVPPGGKRTPVRSCTDEEAFNFEVQDD